MLYYGANQNDCKEIADFANQIIKEKNITSCYDLMCGGANIIDKIESFTGILIEDVNIIIDKISMENRQKETNTKGVKLKVSKK